MGKATRSENPRPAPTTEGPTLLKQTARRIALVTALPTALLGLVLSATPATAAPAASTVERQIVQLTNQKRAQHGCRTVAVYKRLTNAARTHSRDMAARNYFSHTGRDGSNFVARAKRQRYNGALSENIGWGFRSANDMVTAWMNSPGHRRNLLNCRAKSIGVGVSYRTDGTPLYTQVFGRY